MYHQVWALVDGTWYEYEASRNIFAFYGEAREVFETEIEEMLNQKISRINTLNKVYLDIVEEIKNNPQIIIRFEDSITAGNCEYGTRQFINRYHLNDEVSFEYLAAHAMFEQMTHNHSFINAVKVALGHKAEGIVYNDMSDGTDINDDAPRPRKAGPRKPIGRKFVVKK
jgi:hypothetical protein